MEMKIVIISMITYLILFNSCLTFRLRFFHNLVIMATIFISIYWGSVLIGSLFVIPMFVVLVLYVSWIKKEDWFLNVFLIVSSYALLVIIDNLTHLIWGFAGLNLSEHWYIYAIIDYPLFWLICRHMSKSILQIKSKYLLTLSSKIVKLLCIDLILCMLIFILNITMAEQCGSSSLILLSSIVMYTAYFICTYFMAVTIINEYEKNAKIMLKQNSYDNLQEYMMQVEEMYQNLRTFKHDYANVMISMTGFIENSDMDGLKEYYTNQISHISTLLNKKKDAVSGLHNLHMVELKSLVYAKMIYAQELNIDVSLEITDKIDEININSFDLVRMIGILLDNAIEACQECENPKIAFSIVKIENDITFIIRNTYIRHNIDYSKLGNIGVSSKGERRGIGLYNIKSILKDYDHVVLDTEYLDGYFTQYLEIYDKNREVKVP